jgi:tetratricopeptide (TPR) repeat protein
VTGLYGEGSYDEGLQEEGIEDDLQDEDLQDNDLQDDDLQHNDLQGTFKGADKNEAPQHELSQRELSQLEPDNRSHVAGDRRSLEPKAVRQNVQPLAVALPEGIASRHGSLDSSQNGAHETAHKKLNIAALGGLHSHVSQGAAPLDIPTAEPANSQLETNTSSDVQSDIQLDVQALEIQSDTQLDGQADTPLDIQLDLQTPSELSSFELSSESPGESLDHAANQTASQTASQTANQAVAIAPLLSEQQARQKAADDYFAVGHVYRSHIEAGERSLDLIEKAIAAYEGGLQCLSGPHPDWGSGLNDLGTLYWLKAQQLNDPQQCVDAMAHSIELYQEALTKADPQQSGMFSQLYSNMGSVYSMLATYDTPMTYLQQAATAYSKALPLCSLEDEPEEYATLQNSLGSVYWKLSHYESVQVNLHRAVAAYNQALLGYSPERQPLDYAAVQNNLGITYWSLAKHDQPAVLLKHAIAAYRDALNYRTPEVDPAACAITYNNLALAYWDLSKDKEIDPQQKSRYQKNAVTAFEAALSVSKSASILSQADSAAIYHCLGDVHAQMAGSAASLTEIASSLQKSLHSFIQAIDGLPSDSPAYQGRLAAIVDNMRAHYDQLGLAGQQAALNRVPPSLLSQVMIAL